MRRLHPYSGAIRALGNAVSGGSFGLFLGIAVGVASGDEMNLLLTVPLTLLGGLAGLAYGAARYLRFEYETADGTFSMATGVFNRQERDIPYGRIQNVDVRRGIVYRLLGLATIKLETAGGGSTEAVLNAVAVAEAERIQDAVAGHRDERGRESSGAASESTGQVDSGTAGRAETATAGETRPGESSSTGTSTASSGAEGTASSIGTASQTGGPTRETIFELSTNDLALLSAVSFDPSGLALLIFTLPFGQEFAFEILARTVAAVGGPTIPSLEAITGLSTLQVGLVLFVAAVQFTVAAWAASAVITAVKFYDFRLTRVGEDLRYERGLLQRYTGTIPLEKVQTVTVRENVAMRRFGYAALDLETAGYGPGQGGNASNTAIPLDDREVVIALAERLGEMEYPSIERPPKRARRRYAVRFSLVPVGLAVVLFAVDWFLWSLPWWIPLLALPLAPIAGHYAWKHRGHALVERSFLARSGFWRRHTRVVPYFRIQTVIDSRSVFQRWRNLASVTADTASTASLVGGDATAHDIDEATAVDLHRTLRARLAADLDRQRSRDGATIGTALFDESSASDDPSVSESGAS